MLIATNFRLRFRFGYFEVQDYQEGLELKDSSEVLICKQKQAYTGLSVC
jgi:hypothetical protein